MSIYDLNYNGRDDDKRVTYRDVFKQAEEEYSGYNFEYADTAMLLQGFRDAERECKSFLAKGEPKSSTNAIFWRCPPTTRHQGDAHLQSARRARRDLGDGAAKLISCACAILRRRAARRGSRRRQAAA